VSPLAGAEGKLRDIRSVTDAALSYLGADDLLAELLARVKEILDADTVAVLLLDSSGRQLIATAASGLEEEVRQGVRIPVGQGFAGRIAAGGRPVILDHVDHGNVLNPILLDKGIQSLVGVPLLVHGAVIMGRMRSALRSYALEYSDPAEVLRMLDRKMQYFEGEVMATVSYAVLDPASRQLRISSAGHFPPVIAVPGQRGALAEIAVDAPIGVADTPRRQVTTLTIVSGSVLCFFTDGLVERRDEPLDDGIARLCAAVAPGPPENVCISVMGAMVGSQRPGDDIALLALRWQREASNLSGYPA
jgi:hypothetical protein